MGTGSTGAIKSGFMLQPDCLDNVDVHIAIAHFIAVYQFHRDEGWEKLPDMLRKRHYMMCGLVTDNAGNRKIVVAGGVSL